MVPAPVTVVVEDGLGVVRIQREHGNAINEEVLEGLLAAFRALEADEACRGVLLASGHPRLFCPGLDLRELSAYDRPRMTGFMERFNACLLTLYTYPGPLVAAISGHAVAGGCLLTLTADRRILRRGASVGLGEIRVGVPLPLGSALILREAIHLPRLDEVALLGLNYTDEEAVAVGLVHEIHESEGFEPYCLERLAEYASRDPQAFALTKRHLRSDTVERIRKEDAQFLPAFLDCWFSARTRRRVEEMLSLLEVRDE